MAKCTKKRKNCGQSMHEDALEGFSAGTGYNDLARLRVKCPVEGCGFESDTFGEMNIHMRTVHPGRC